MKLLSAQQIQQWDAYTVANEPISSINLMERAASVCLKWLVKNNYAEQPIKIFCGKGNNGGDGLAIARQLLLLNKHPQVYILEFGQMDSADFRINLQRLHLLTTNITFIQSADFFPIIKNGDILIDALFGSGLNKPLKDLSKALVEHINKAGATTIAIDVPSGMPINKSCKTETVVRAAHTLSFEVIKPCLLMAENADFFGNVHILNIGLHPNFLQTINTTFNTLQQSFIATLLKPINHFAHKGSFGHAFLVAGNKGKMGASILAAKACLRSGVGLLTLNIPEDCLMVPQTAVPEAMCQIRNKENIDWNTYAAIGIGPGLGTDIATQNLVKSTLLASNKTVVIDADALNCIAINKESNWLNLIPENAIITPHPKEFDRLFGNHDNEFARIDKAIEASTNYNFVIVLKGHHTLIAYKGKGWFNTTGNSGMAKGGSGDVLTGIITSFLAQQYTTINAALLGVYLHGLAGDITLQSQTINSMLPSDLVENLGKAFTLLRH